MSLPGPITKKGGDIVHSPFSHRRRPFTNSRSPCKLIVPTLHFFSLSISHTLPSVLPITTHRCPGYDLPATPRRLRRSDSGLAGNICSMLPSVLRVYVGCCDDDDSLPSTSDYIRLSLPHPFPLPVSLLSRLVKFCTCHDSSRHLIPSTSSPGILSSTLHGLFQIAIPPLRLYCYTEE